MIFIYFCGLSYDLDSGVKQYAEFLSYLVILFFPFVCILSLPELQNKIRKILPLRRRRARAIGPEIIILRNNQNARVLKNNIQ
jgi:hypothetical protein